MLDEQTLLTIVQLPDVAQVNRRSYGFAIDMNNGAVIQVEKHTAGGWKPTVDGNALTPVRPGDKAARFGLPLVAATWAVAYVVGVDELRESKPISYGVDGPSAARRSSVPTASSTTITIEVRSDAAPRKRCRCPGPYDTKCYECAISDGDIPF